MNQHRIPPEPPSEKTLCEAWVPTHWSKRAPGWGTRNIVQEYQCRNRARYRAGDLSTRGTLVCGVHAREYRPERKEPLTPYPPKGRTSE